MSPEGHRMRAESVPELKQVGGAPPHAAAVVVGEDQWLPRLKLLRYLFCFLCFSVEF